MAIRRGQLNETISDRSISKVDVMAKAVANRKSAGSAAPAQLPSWLAGPVPVMVLTALLLLPFINKAFHIDDTLFLRVAEQVRREPLHPYRMDFNWAGKNETFWNATQNPPLGGYLIAGVSLVSGFVEWPLHLAFASMAVGCSLLMHRLARRCCRHPTLAVAGTILTPAFLVTACNVMADIPLLFFWLLAVWAAVEYVESSRTGMIWLAGLAASAASMSKYFGTALVPLLLVYCLSSKGGRRWHTMALLLPVMTLAAWGSYAHGESGLFHPLTAAAYSVEYKESTDGGLMHAIGCFFTYLGGGIVWPIVLVPLLFFGSRRVVLAVTQFVALAAIVALLVTLEYRDVKGVEPLPRGPLWTYLLMLLAGAMTVLAALRGWIARFDRLGTLLGLWFFGTVAFCVFFNWTMNERIILPAIFPAAVLAIRWIESIPAPRPWLALTTAAMFPLVGLSLLVAAADYQFASAGRTFAGTTVARHTSQGRRVHFAGHWGFQFYMEQQNATAIDFAAPDIRPGDHVVYPTIHTTSEPPPAGSTRFLVDTKNTFDNGYGIQTMSDVAGAGFYSSIFGNVPYAPATKDPNRQFVDRFVILEYLPPQPRR